MTLRLPTLSLVILIPALSGCGVGCLYTEQGRVVATTAGARVSPERLVAAVESALRPLGFSGEPAQAITPRPEWYWDYTFSTPRKFWSPAPVDVEIRFTDLSITISDFSRSTTATDFDRRVVAAIQDA